MGTVSSSRDAVLDAAEVTSKLQLPSGRQVKVRKPPPLMLAMLGMGIRISGRLRGEPESPKVVSDAEAKEIVQLMVIVLNHCLVSPRISEHASGPDEILPKDLSMEDALFIVRWALRHDSQPVVEEHVRSKCKTRPRVASRRSSRRRHK
jgi:hypothetical protein